MNKRERAIATHRYLTRFAAENFAYRDAKMGTLGPASPVRRINPVTGEVMANPEPPVSTPAPIRRPMRRGYWHKQFAAKMADDKA
jgi:hypothetical protein